MTFCSTQTLSTLIQTIVLVLMTSHLHIYEVTIVLKEKAPLWHQDTVYKVSHCFKPLSEEGCCDLSPENPIGWPCGYIGPRVQKCADEHVHIRRRYLWVLAVGPLWRVPTEGGLLSS
jgi:hypothetical protein